IRDDLVTGVQTCALPILVAINKVDREQANPERVMQQLSEHGLIPTQWNGDTEMVQVSALQNLGIDDLLDTLLITADLEELQANQIGRAACREKEERHRYR